MDKKTVGLIERSGIYNDNITANQIKEIPKKVKDTTLIVPYFGSPNYLAGILGSTNYPVVATETESNTASTAIPLSLACSCNGIPSFL